MNRPYTRAPAFDLDKCPLGPRESVLGSGAGRQVSTMITGFNTDVRYRGVVYHVQTEDKGPENPLIETLIYKGGEILGSRRLPYGDVLSDLSDESAILKLMEDQHKGMIMEVKRGRFDPAADQTQMEDLSLDELVLAYLASRAAAGT
jgi:hypothetical protein